MNELEIWSAAVGVFLPLVIAIINQRLWPKPVKGIVAFLVCVLASVVTVYLRGELNLANLVHSGIVVVSAAVVLYNMLWKPSEIAPRIEAATSLR